MIILSFFSKLCKIISFFRKFPYLLAAKKTKKKGKKRNFLCSPPLPPGSHKLGAAGGRPLTASRPAVACAKRTAVLELGEWIPRFEFVCFVVLRMEVVWNIMLNWAWIWICLWFWLCPSLFHFCILCKFGNQYALLGRKWFLGI